MILDEEDMTGAVIGPGPRRRLLAYGCGHRWSLEQSLSLEVHQALSLQVTFCHAFVQSGDPRQKGRLNGVPFTTR